MQPAAMLQKPTRSTRAAGSLVLRRMDRRGHQEGHRRPAPAGVLFYRRLRSHTCMDEDLANIIRRALAEARAAGRDDTGQTEQAVRKVRELRPDMTATDALNAINLVRSFL